MFFSDDLLTNKKGSFGIVWLAATLGPRNRRITRRQLTTVDLSGTCQLIAQPPEPMALRLSGCLLVGVARVYNQNYEVFYHDVNKFHIDLRRLMATEYSPTSRAPEGGPAYIDVLGGGKSKYDQITYAGLDVEWLSGLDLNFHNIDWNNPSFERRRRRASSQLSSLATQQYEDEEEDEEENMSSDDEREEEDVRSPEGVRARKKQKNDGSPSMIGARLTLTPRTRLPHDNPTNSQDMPFMPDGIDLGLLEIMEPGVPSSDPPFVDDWPMVVEQMDGAEIIDTGAQGDIQQIGLGDPTRHTEKSKTPDSLSEIEAIVTVKEKKARKARKVQFDDTLEISHEESRVYNSHYVLAMQRDLSESRAKETARAEETRAARLVNNAGNFTEYFDVTMNVFFSNLGNFQFAWEKEASKTGHAGGADARAPHNTQFARVDPDVQDVPDLPQYPDTTGNETYIEEYHDLVVPVRDFEGDEPHGPNVEEVRKQRGSQGTPNIVLPWHGNAADWSDGIGFDDFVDGFSPASRLSLMTPLEKRIRTSRLGKQQGSQARSRLTRSPSVPGGMDVASPKMLIGTSGDQDEGEIDITPSQMIPNLPDAFQPPMLASLDGQCRSFFTYVERQMMQNQTSEMCLQDLLVGENTSKHVVSAAFYNCLTLATKRILSLSQATSFGDITFSFAVDL